jgi:hypothetical protein
VITDAGAGVVLRSQCVDAGRFARFRFPGDGIRSTECGQVREGLGGVESGTPQPLLLRVDLFLAREAGTALGLKKNARRTNGHARSSDSRGVRRDDIQQLANYRSAQRYERPLRDMSGRFTDVSRHIDDKFALLSQQMKAMEENLNAYPG